MGSIIKLYTYGIFFVTILSSASAWSGHVCTRIEVRYRQERDCDCHFLWWCTSYYWRWVGYYVNVQYCCPGWTHNGDENCVQPVCNPGCQNGGVCSAPGRCSCPTTYQGYRCDTATCSYRRPCFPGVCTANSNCDCSNGFQTLSADPQNFCLNITDDQNSRLTTTEMLVRMSYWPRDRNMQLYMIVADSTMLPQDKMGFFWSNRRIFNRVETQCLSQYIPPTLTDPPPYVSNYKFGIVAGKIELYLKKLAPGGADGSYTSLNKTIPCIQSVSPLSPNDQLYNCSIVDPNFDRTLEHRDALKFTFKTEGGGFRTLLDTDNYNRFWRNQIFASIKREQSVQFMFDFRDPTHCEELSACTRRETMLHVPDKTQNATISIQWDGWQDVDSGMHRYAWEVFKMTKATEGELEIHPDRALQPLRPPTEVLHTNYSTQNFTLPGPGMYSIILEVGDLANNTKFIRRLCLFDPSPQITSDPEHKFYVTTASQAANYVYQNDTSVPIHVTWEKHFRNALHEDEGLLGRVRPYPPELQEVTERVDDEKRFRKVISNNSKQEDHEGERTVDRIMNKRGIVSFYTHHEKDSNGGRNKSAVPPSWTSLGLNTNYTLSGLALNEADTVIFWVKATDYMGSEKVEVTQVSFDSTPPSIIGTLAFHMNVPVPHLNFSSTLELHAIDEGSGVAYVLWTFHRASNMQVLYQEKVPGASVSEANCRPQDIQTCKCLMTGHCFLYDNSFSLTNCLMVTGLDQSSLETESIIITADVTNMAGLVKTVNITKSDLTSLNGTQGYFPPQNVTVVSRTSNSVTFNWTFPPSCFQRRSLWVVVNGNRMPVHKDARSFTVGNLVAGTSYTFRILTEYDHEIESEQAPFTFQTDAEEAIGVGGIIGIIVALLLLACLVTIIVMFVLWKKGKVFQKEGTVVNRQLHRMSRAVETVRRTVRRSQGDAEGGFSNAAYSGDEIYLYGAMAFHTKPAWQLNDISLSLVNQVAEGRFAVIYKATWKHDGNTDTVAAKMLKAKFTEEDALKMQAKINFMATQLEDHDNVIRFLGAVIDNRQWGPVLVMEYCDVGQLDKWLVQRRGQMTEDLMDNLFRFTLEVAKGMHYLTTKKILHRRLAARNILLTLDLEVKIAGFGPQPKEGDTEGEEQGKVERVPIKWAAPEVLQNKTPTQKSDVWSYGILLWEIFSMGGVPYPNVRSNEVGTRLKSGYRMDKPEFADDFYYDLMKECWQYKPAKRPTFSTIKAKLSQFYNPSNRQSNAFYYDTNALKPQED